MNSQTRAWVVTSVMILTWSTPLTAPFRYFAEMIVSLVTWLTGYFDASAALATILVFTLMSVILGLLLWLSRSRQRLYLAGFAALAEVIYHLWICIRNDKIYDVSLPITIGLALALLFLLIPNKTPSLWLSDAFVVSIAAWLVINTIFAGLYEVFAWPRAALAPVLIIPDQAPVINLSGWLSLPLAVWAILTLAFAVIPLLAVPKGQTGHSRGR